MTRFNTQTTIGELVVQSPRRARVFERFGIDYCCGGKRALAAVCRERAIPMDDVLAALSAADAEGASSHQPDWTLAPLPDLIDHIVDTHHAYLVIELPRLERMIDKVAVAHGGRHPELFELRRLFVAFRSELEAHMFKEEEILFPMVRRLAGEEGPLTLHCGSITNPIRVMESEHDSAGRALARMRDITGGFIPPGDGCNTYRALLAGLSELEADMHQHVHKENNILFPRAAAVEASFAQTT